MHITETFTREEELPAAVVLTFDGEGRSGKGTSVEAVKEQQMQAGRTVVSIDQGKKFRALAILAVRRGNTIDDPDRLSDFLRIDSTRTHMQALLDEACGRAEQGDLSLNKLIESPDTGSISARVGKIDLSHRIAIDTLFDKVQASVAEDVDTILVDGRCMDKYGRLIAERKIAQYGIGFYFRCDSGVAATRSLGQLAHPDTMDEVKKLEIFDEMIRIRDRNRSDTLRPVDPMRQPHGAYELDLANFDIGDHDAVQKMALDSLVHGIVSLNTSYTRTIQEMTVPVIALASQAVALHDREREAFITNPGLWDGGLMFGDARRSYGAETVNSI